MEGLVVTNFVLVLGVVVVVVVYARGRLRIEYG